MMDERSLCGDAEWNEIKRTVINSVKGSVYPAFEMGKGGGREGVGRTTQLVLEYTSILL